MAWQRVRIPIPDTVKPSDREVIGEYMVALMREKAYSGIGVKESDGRFTTKKFPAYTDRYAKFKGQSNVDLTLSGSMLESLEVLSHSKGSILIGFENGTKENDKAEGNITGSYGRSPNPGKARNFLGLLKSEVKAIVREYEKS